MCLFGRLGREKFGQIKGINKQQSPNQYTFKELPFSCSSSGTGRSLLGTGLRSCAKLEKLRFCSFGVGLTAPSLRFSEALCAGEDAGSRVRLFEGVAGEDFWKKPRIDFWVRMFWVLGVVRLSAGDGDAADGDEADGLAIFFL